MRAYEREPMAKHTSLRIGGPVRRLLIPETREELIEAVRDCRARRLPYTVVGRGSNILAADSFIDRVIIKNTEACRTLTISADGLIEAGASVPLQEFVRFCLDHERHGMEYLYSIPGNIGGAVYMNAGRGRDQQLGISDYLVSVEVFDGERCFLVPKASCEFSYRDSIFHRKPWTILSAQFRLPEQPRAVGQQKVEERMAFTRRAQDHTAPNAGTVFKEGFGRYGYAFRGRRVNGAMFSPKTKNWILNVDRATARDVKRLLAIVRWHFLVRLRRPPVLEWIKHK
jgi:UDP-N-acetylmuramate dehydrogenase